MTLNKINFIRTILFNTQKARTFSITASKYEKAVASQSEVRLSWDQAVDDAIQCIRYQSPFPKLRYMTVNKHVNWLSNLEKLEQIDHPLRETVK